MTRYANPKPLSLRARLMPPLIRLSLGRVFSRALSPQQRRQALALSGALLKPIQAAGADSRSKKLGGRPALEVTPRTADKGHRLLYFHGGGYVVGTPQLYRSLAQRLAALTGASVWLPDYRLAPEHPFPAAVDDALAAYRALLDAGIPASQIALGGDSAGGGLALACALAARDTGLPLPSALFCFSPWADLSLSGESVDRCADSELILSRPEIERFAQDYLAGQDPQGVLASPLFADLRGLPPLLIQVTDTEILFDDSQRLAAAAQAAGMEVRLEVWAGLWHVWQVMPVILPEADQALQSAAGFLNAIWSKA